jgi:hypothetical protein
MVADQGKWLDSETIFLEGTRGTQHEPLRVVG